ncbi:uncharacterized protein TNCV_3507611 [Trichonephila clavipes]|uniref:Uncharacterized protein n=1 Tax=Trichonephila clavipes TaxID=2585209 RepID=A0A8X6RZ86_TRICX|nr:uncharacterized protein TNCV_3507611 [Trichonephila clavipes]
MTLEIATPLRTVTPCHLENFELDRFNVLQPSLNGVSSVALGLELVTRQLRVTAVAEWSRYRIEAGIVTNSSPVRLKTHRVGERYTLNLSRAQTSSRWFGVVVRRGGCQLRCHPRHLTMVHNYVVRRQKPSCS